MKTRTLCLGILLGAAASAGFSQEAVKSADYLQIVTAYADAMLERGRDVYGSDQSPLFASALGRKSMRLFEGAALEEIAGITRDSWGIRPHDRVLTGANPMHDQNLYQILYALSVITEDARYREEADNTLRWFFQHCQSPKTGLFAWGEHIGWDFNTGTIIENQGGKTHEYFRPWVLWERSFDLAPKACADFSLGVWEHQIGDRKTGNFSRHARWDEHGPGTNSEYPRHGGFYIATWAHAYNRTKDPVFIKAIETLLGYFEKRRNPDSGAIPAESAERSKGAMMWPPSNVSLAVDLWEGAGLVPGGLAEKMRRSAQQTDRIFLGMSHDLRPDGRGFIKTAKTATLEAMEGGYTRLWETGYGDQTTAAIANLCLLRYQQVCTDGYKQLAVNAAYRYLDSEPLIEFPVYPGTLGDVIHLMLGAYKITGEEKCLHRANHFACQAIGLFLDGSPLPSATNKHDHYEAITRADTLMMALLELWIIENRPDAEVDLVYTDR